MAKKIVDDLPVSLTEANKLYLYRLLRDVPSSANRRSEAARAKS